MDPAMIGVLLVLGLAYFVISVWTQKRGRRTRIVTCPLTGDFAAIDVDDGVQAQTYARYAVTSCSLWPKSECTRACIVQRR
jgi:hypothetical protein